MKVGAGETSGVGRGHCRVRGVGGRRRILKLRLLAEAGCEAEVEDLEVKEQGDKGQEVKEDSGELARDDSIQDQGDQDHQSTIMTTTIMTQHMKKTTTATTMTTTWVQKSRRQRLRATPSCQQYKGGLHQSCRILAARTTGVSSRYNLIRK